MKKMAKQKEIKTNAMRMLDRMKIPYEAMTYECGDFIDTDEQYHMFRPESDTADPVTDHIQIDQLTFLCEGVAPR